ncbi:MAG TPA: DUF192 domain-containing protein [Terracidiphilus sp.]|jgi:uncharacterized membrane protein (UPF0127 family)|nr:DUF192 domain-containing protein [Terracidiphilus sp.]
MDIQDQDRSEPQESRRGAQQAAGRPLRILNATRGIELASAARVAATAAQRSKGLLGRAGLEPGEALWIVPCEAVHTFWMKFALDLVYLDRRHRIVKIRRNVPPWRLSGALRAHSVIEFAAGAIRAQDAAPGDQLTLEAAEETPVPASIASSG